MGSWQRILKASVTSDSAAAAIVEAAEISRTTAIEFFQTAAELGERFRAPQLALRVQGELQLFDDPGSADQPGPILAVEYKGADRWAGAEEDRLIGGLWANLSEGRCRFVMVRDKRWEWIEEKLSPSLVRQD